MQATSDDALRSLCTRIAIHESGHAVPALALPELILERMTLTVDPTACSAQGRTQVSRRDHTLRHRKAELISCLGGKAAEHVMLGNVHEALSSADSREAAALAKEIAGGDEFAARGILVAATKCAAVIIMANRSLLELLACRLQSELVLDSASIIRATAAFPPVVP